MASNLGQWAMWAEAQIASVVVAEGLHVTLLGATQGPHVFTFRVALRRPGAADLRRLLGLGPALALSLRVQGVRISAGGEGVCIEVPLPEAARRSPTEHELSRAAGWPLLALGVDAMRRPVWADLRQHGAILWIGPSRRGKTQSMRCALFGLAAAGAGYVIVSQKTADWRPFELAAGCLGLVSDPAEGEACLRWAARGVRGRAARGGNTPALIVVVDDLQGLIEASPAIAEPLGVVASMGAGCGVHLLAGSQEAGSRRGTGGAVVENSATARILYRPSSAAAGARAAGQAGEALQQLTGSPGDAVILIDGEGRRAQTGIARDEAILRLAQRPGERKRPWLRAATGHNRPQPATTGHNHLQPATTGHNRAQPAGAHPHEGARESADGGGDPQPVAAVAPVVGLFPIAKRPPTEAEAEAIRALHSAGESLSALCRRVYGFKDGEAFGWVRAAVQDASAQSAQSAASGAVSGADLPERIDLSTEAGRAQLEGLVRAGLWRPDAVTAPQ